MAKLSRQPQIKTLYFEPIHIAKIAQADLPKTVSESFDPMDFGFSWAEDWYVFDSNAAHLAARQARYTRTKELKKQGYKVTTSSSKQLRRKGGIGTGHPEIDEVVTVYSLYATL